MAPILPASNDTWEEVSDDEVSSGDVEPIPIILNIDSDSNSDDEVPLHTGYELLPQEPDTDGNQVVFESDEDDVPFANSERGDSEGVASPAVHSLFTQALGMPSPPEWMPNENVPVPDESKDTNPMDTEQIEKIKSAMAGFTLPSSAFPDWAALIPEEEWKMQLVARLQSKKGGAQCSFQESASGKDQTIKSANIQEQPTSSKVTHLNRTLSNDSVPNAESSSHFEEHFNKLCDQKDKSD